MIVDDLFFTWEHTPSSTLCLVYKNPPKGRLRNGEALLNAIAKLHPNDHYDRSKGRKMALLRALQVLTQMNLIDDGFRERAWEVYRTMTKEPRWPKKATSSLK